MHGTAELKERPLVSVVIPTHNRARLLQEAVASVLAQEGVGEQFNMEVIVVDHASSDETPEIVRFYPGIRYIRLPIFLGGPSASRNVGIKASSGKYVAFLDDDDLWLPDKLRLQVPMLEAHLEAGVVYSQIVFRFEGTESVEPKADKAVSGMLFREVLMGFFFPFMGNVLIRREALEKAGYFDETLRSHEDYELTARLAFHVPFIFVPGSVCIYRLSKEGSLWISALARGEEGEAFLSIEKALTMLPDSEDYMHVKLEARARGKLGIADDFGIVGNFDKMRGYMRTALEMFPALLEDQRALQVIARMAQRVAHASPSPVAAVRAFCAEVRGTERKRGVREGTRMRHLLADMWTVAAIQLGSGFQPRHRAAGYAAACALLYHPANLSSTLLKLVVRGIVGTRVYTLLAVLKQNLS